MRKSKFFPVVSYSEARKMGPRRFVKEVLFPVMRREHGIGFAMETWFYNTRLEHPNGLDGVSHREPPACNSVMCIGGTMQAITGSTKEENLARLLGLPLYAKFDHNDVRTLFDNWTLDQGPWKGLSKAFAKAKTPAQKERIAEKAVMAAIRIGERLKKP